MRKASLIFCLFMLIGFSSYAQLSTNEPPMSFNKDLTKSIKKKSKAPIAILPQLDMAIIEAEDKEDMEYDIPPRFGYRHKVNYDLTNSGTWYELPNGDKLWQLDVVCPNALSVNFCYNRFWIPEGGKFFVYSKDKKHSIGAFTSRNNKGSRNDTKGFATGLIYGSEVVLEYYQPKNVTADAIISIDYIVHGYRYISFGEKALGDGGNCMVNINCEEGQNWQCEKNAVAMILVYGNRYCTGALINTTSLSQEPLFLTANHCISRYGDAVDNPDLSYYSFYWNYEAPGCLNVNTEPGHTSTTGATILANNPDSDFALLKLTEDPKNLSTYIPSYLGWDCTGQSGVPGICIHHPHGDVKKISSVNGQPISTYYLNYAENLSATHWKVIWGATLNGHGTTEGGSSGSPLLSADHKLIGQLHGGYANCGDSILAPDWYGKFNVSWNGNSNSSIYRRLNCWIDSLNTNVQAMEGLVIIPIASTITSQQLYSNICITSTGQLTVQNHIEMMGNSRIIVETGGKLIIDGGTLSNVDLNLKPGASLQIINGGIIETRSGFEAPVGSLVNIESGQIL